MRFASPAYGLLAAGALAYGCTVYDSGLTTGELTGGGEAGSVTQGGSSSSDGGKSSMTAGTLSTTAGTKTDAGATATGGSAPMSDGGMGNEGGENPASSGGSMAGGGSGGSGGASAGAGGKGGTGGTGGSASGGTGGGGGSGGSAPVAKCADHPITAKALWVPTAYTFSAGNGMESDGLYNPPEHMTDGNFSERWSSGQPQAGVNEWIQIDFTKVVNLTSITLAVDNNGDYPRHYEVRFTNALDAKFTSTPLLSEDGIPGNNTILFNGIVTGRYLTVKQTGKDVAPDTNWWSVAELLAACTDP